jgi:hypothetical protein
MTVRDRYRILQSLKWAVGYHGWMRKRLRAAVPGAPRQSMVHMVEQELFAAQGKLLAASRYLRMQTKIAEAALKVRLIALFALPRSGVVVVVVV